MIAIFKTETIICGAATANGVVYTVPQGKVWWLNKFIAQNATASRGEVLLTVITNGSEHIVCPITSLSTDQAPVNMMGVYLTEGDRLQVKFRGLTAGDQVSYWIRGLEQDFAKSYFIM